MPETYIAVEVLKNSGGSGEPWVPAEHHVQSLTDLSMALGCSLLLGGEMGTADSSQAIVNMNMK